MLRLRRFCHDDPPPEHHRDLTYVPAACAGTMPQQRTLNYKRPMDSRDFKIVARHVCNAPQSQITWSLTLMKRDAPRANCMSSSARRDQDVRKSPHSACMNCGARPRHEGHSPQIMLSSDKSRYVLIEAVAAFHSGPAVTRACTLHQTVSAEIPEACITSRSSPGILLANPSYIIWFVQQSAHIAFDFPLQQLDHDQHLLLTTGIEVEGQRGFGPSRCPAPLSRLSSEGVQSPVAPQ